MDQLLQALGGALATVLTGAALALAHKLAQKLDVQLNEQQDAALRNDVQNAITGAQEKALHMAKVQNATISSEAKLDMAVSAVLEKAPGVTQAQAEQLVHEELPKVRAALGAAMGTVEVKSPSV